MRPVPHSVQRNVDRRFVRRASVARNSLLGGLALVLLGFAVYRLIWSRGAEDEAPAGPDSNMNFVCEQCSEFFPLSGREFEQAERQGKVGRAADGKSLAVTCPKCGKTAGVRAERCPEHGEIVKVAPGPRDALKCSKCEFRP